jgi:hypothetical protein
MSTQPNKISSGDLAYAIAYAGAIGSAVIATLFLILDTFSGRPLDTPMLMGSAIFLGELPSGTGPLRLDLAAGYSLVHFVMFTAVGGAFAVFAQRLRGLPKLPTVLVTGLFLTLSAGLITLDALVAPDLVAAIGLAPMALGNLFASVGMTAFYVQAFELEGSWVKVPTTLIGDSE